MGVLWCFLCNRSKVFTCLTPNLCNGLKGFSGHLESKFGSRKAEKVQIGVSHSKMGKVISLKYTILRSILVSLDLLFNTFLKQTNPELINRSKKLILSRPLALSLFFLHIYQVHLKYLKYVILSVSNECPFKEPKGESIKNF